MTGLVDIFGADDAPWMSDPARNCAIPKGADHRAIRANADGHWFPRDKFHDAAKAHCDGCPVKDECLTYALDNNEVWGIWGGLTPEERAEQRKSGDAA